MTDAIQMDVTAVLVEVALALLSAVLAFATQWLRRHLSDRQIVTGAEIARIAVRAVEQIAAVNGLSSAEKLHAASVRARQIAADAGLSFSDAQWNTFIERAVGEMNAAAGTLLASYLPSDVTHEDARPAALHTSGPNAGMPLA